MLKCPGLLLQVFCLSLPLRNMILKLHRKKKKENSFLWICACIFTNMCMHIHKTLQYYTQTFLTGNVSVSWAKNKIKGSYYPNRVLNYQAATEYAKTAFPPCLSLEGAASLFTLSKSSLPKHWCTDSIYHLSIRPNGNTFLLLPVFELSFWVKIWNAKFFPNSIMHGVN